MKKQLRAAVSALMLAALLAPAALGGVMEADGASPQPTPPPAAATSPAEPSESEPSAVTLVEVVLDLFGAVLPLF